VIRAGASLVLHSREVRAQNVIEERACRQGEITRVRERLACLDEVLPLLGLWNATSLYVASRRGKRRRGRSGSGDGGGSNRKRGEAAEEEVEAKL